MGNTEKLNNASIQWTKELDDTFFYVGGRYLSAGITDVYTIAAEYEFASGITFAAPLFQKSMGKVRHHCVSDRFTWKPLVKFITRLL